jgi:parallel beta-helix repeat protein
MQIVVLSTGRFVHAINDSLMTGGIRMKCRDNNMWTKCIARLAPMLALVAITGSPDLAGSATIHADSGLSGDCVGSYDPTTRSCGSGTAVAYRTLNDAAAASQAGDDVLLRGGNFQEILSPPQSGTPGNYITFKSFPGETATLSGVNNPAISLLNRSYLIIEALTVTDVLGWGRIERSSYNIFRNNRFARAAAHGTTGGLKFVKSTFNKVLNNSFDDGNDSLVLQESDRNLLQGNTFTKARHSLLSVRCGNFNVIRDNRFHNADQKACEIYDCEGTSDAPIKLNATMHNLFDGNTFTYTKASDRHHRYNGIQYGGQNGILRRNVFYSNQGGALAFQVYPNEALYNNSNRVFNNTFYNNRCYGMSASAASGRGRYFGNMVINNIFYMNTSCSGGANQTAIGNTTAVKLKNNAIVTTSPLFVDVAGRDFHLKSGSSMIDAGAFATRTVGAGSDKVLKVEDVGYFFDGFGIPGEIGDLIQLEGGSATVRIVQIDYTNGTLTLDQSITWTAGQHLHLQYSGVGPDMGAFERQLETYIPPPTMNMKINP